MAADLAPSSPTRIAAAAMLARLQTAHSNVEQAVSQATGRSAQSLGALAAHLASAEQALAQSLQSGGPLANLDLGALDRLIQTSESNAQAAVAASAADAAATASAQALEASTAATRAEVQNFMRDFHRFDGSLDFASKADEEAYHAREIERQREIAADLAKHTPEGTLNAGGLAAGQALDAAAHGATKNPEFLPEWNKLVAQLHQQREAMAANGKSTAQFDRQNREYIRTFLHDKGIPADQIEAVLSSPDPLQAVTPYLSKGNAHELEASLGHAPSSAPPPPSPAAKPIASPEIADVGNLARAGSILSSAGVIAGTSSEPTPPLPQHVQATPSRQSSRAAG